MHTRLLCPSLSRGICSISCPLSWWCYLTISSSANLLSFCLQSFPASGKWVFHWVGSRIRWPKYWSFSISISPSNEYSELISFRIDWFDLLAVQGTLKIFSSITVQKHQFCSIQLSLWSKSHIYTWLNWKNHSFYYTNLCQQSDVSAF